MAFKRHFTHAGIRCCAASCDFWRRVGWIIILSNHAWYSFHLFGFFLFNLQESNLQVRPSALGSCAFAQHCSLQWTCEGSKGGLRVDCRCFGFWQLIWTVALVGALSILKSAQDMVLLSELVLVIRNMFLLWNEAQGRDVKTYRDLSSTEQSCSDFSAWELSATCAHCLRDNVIQMWYDFSTARFCTSAW